jgi:hypothetical protein
MRVHGKGQRSFLLSCFYTVKERRNVGDNKNADWD